MHASSATQPELGGDGGVHQCATFSDIVTDTVTVTGVGPFALLLPITLPLLLSLLLSVQLRCTLLVTHTRACRHIPCCRHRNRYRSRYRYRYRGRFTGEGPLALLVQLAITLPLLLPLPLPVQLPRYRVTVALSLIHI